ncbi:MULTISPECIES: ATP-binding protein [Chitinophaga]|uniref:ATP-binding protein n=1 Tax=Chitinophaga TaxID=79328 RepID=UPI001CED82CF|nr:MULTISPECIES: ATP-binding protein [Chitinophaga]
MQNVAVLETELEWLREVISIRMKNYFDGAGEEIPAPPGLQDGSVYAQIVDYYKMTSEERLLLLLTLTPHIRPQLLDIFFVRNATYDRGFTEFGGIKGQQHGGFLPTGETAAFLLGATDLSARLRLMTMFAADHFFTRHHILRIHPPTTGEPMLSGALNLYPDYINYFTLGIPHQPDDDPLFPAKRIQTALDWSDLVLEEQTMDEVEEIQAWIAHGDQLMNDWGMARKIKPGYRALFYGPPGTGKSLTACLLGKANGHDVYRIDLSMIVSKYIGETEKNLAHVFDKAVYKHWILFFDEADALFGKRTNTSSSNDRYANQEVAYLLQRIEDFPGMVILATNLRANIDEAFGRRFQSMVQFSMPGPEQRLRLWKQSFPDKIGLDPQLNLEDIADKYEIAGGAIINVTRYAALMALKHQTPFIRLIDVMTGIRREFGKEGKTV